MDTFHTIFLEKEDDLSFVEPSEPHKDIFRSYVSMMEILSEIEQLNQVFEYNVRALSHNFILYYNDHIVDKRTKEEADSIEINALFINIISSGRVLVERIETVLKNDFKTDKYLEFHKKYIENVYNEVFAYRFFYALRNICQHGSIVVSHKFNKYCFDLAQLLSVRHFSYNKTEEWERIIEEISTKYKTEPDICFTANLSEYVKEVFKQYYNFLCYIEKDLEDINNQSQLVIKENPEYVCNEGALEGCVVYRNEDGSAHCFFVTEDVMSYYIDYRNKARRRSEEYDDSFHSIT